MLTGHQCGTSMDKVITTRLLRFDLNEHSARHADLSKCELTRILASRLKALLLTPHQWATIIAAAPPP
jgi:hypothetical protein